MTGDIKNKQGAKDLLNTPPEDTEQAANAPENESQHLIPTLDELTAKGIDGSIAAAIVGMDYDGLKKAVDDVIAGEIDKRITANIPKAKQVEEFSSQLKAFESMGYKERLELSKQNPRLYRELTARIMV